MLARLQLADIALFKVKLNVTATGARRMATVFTFVFALACLTTFLCGLRERWRAARLASAVVAVLSFLMALVTVR
jgi:hypothetical protein